MAKQFLDEEGLQTYNELILNYIDTEDAKSIKTISLSRDGSTIYFYKAETVNQFTQPDYEVEFPVTDLSDYMKLVAGAVENNIAVFDADGQVIDSDTALSDLATMDYVGTIPAGYEATTIAEYAKELADNVAANGYDDTELRTRVSAVEEAVETLNADEDTEGSVDYKIAQAIQAEDEQIEIDLSGKADKATTLEGYGIEDAYTKDETDVAIAEAVANADHLKRAIVDELPDVSEADENTIYMVHKEGEDGDEYYEYMVINGAWELIGSSEVDLTDYATKEYADEAAAEVLGEEGDEAGKATVYGALALAQEANDAVDEIGAIPTEDIQALFE